MHWHPRLRVRAGAQRSGFTLSEVMIASGIFVVVMAGALTIYVWVLVRTAWVQHVIWSYNEARRSSRDIVEYIRNASEITQVDTNKYQWIELKMADGSRTRFVVVNPPGDVQRDSYLYMSNSVTGRSTIIARGLTGLMSPDGFTRPIFFVQPNQRSLRIGFRVTEPVPTGQEAVDDSRIAAIIDTGVTLRNALPAGTP